MNDRQRYGGKGLGERDLYILNMSLFKGEGKEGRVRVHSGKKLSLGHTKVKPELLLLFLHTHHTNTHIYHTQKHINDIHDFLKQ